MCAYRMAMVVPQVSFSRSEFSTEWWAWMCTTGVFLACTLGCKMVGLFTFFTVGTAVLVDMWDILDIRKRYPMVRVIVRLWSNSHIILGPRDETFLCSCPWSHRRTVHCLLLLLLGSFQSAFTFRNRR